MSSRAEQKREAREQRQAAEQADADAAARRKRTAFLAGGIALIALIVVVALVLVNQSGSGDVDVDANASFTGVEQSGFTLGDAKAPVTVVEFADLQCPFCRDFALDDLPAIVTDYVKPGDVKMELRLLGFIGEDSLTGREVAAGAVQQDRVWPFAENVYAHQGTENTGYMTEDFLREQATGIDGLDADQAIAAIGSPEAGKYGTESDSEAQAAGVQSTPSFLVGPTGSQDMKLVDAGGLRGAIEDALAQAGG